MNSARAKTPSRKREFYLSAFASWRETKGSQY
jgi:hypothetical protein